MYRVAVVGGGSWGTTLANLIAEDGHPVDLWVWEEEVCRQIRQERVNGVFLPGVKLSSNLRAVTNMEEALHEKSLVLMVVPSHVFREVLIKMKPHLPPQALVLSATKGIENDSLMMMSQVCQDVIEGWDQKRFGCLAGPSFAKEVCQHFPTAVTIACVNLNRAKELQRFLYREFFRIYVSDDVIGVQLAGALKNVIAIGAGASDGLRFGHNARAALITRGLAEITRLGVAMGANPMTFAGLAGMGDLVLTCTGDLSRNRSVGLQIGQGRSLEEITRDMQMVAEGVKTARSAHELAKRYQVEMPITEQVYQILYKGKDPKAAVRDLMTRTLKSELDH
ncbi:MAG: glycerol-3-phosphate dehydrogenase [Deltaproteobacteria bacterium]|mgnify:CR=1 FL=1|nr:MAG: glycerol-3-phosphate dehydrogenase [Deltaproteobacteria bacterium]RLB20295.1 MAG: glycerol-3-phosphate dehydrogenase [Deltaproteobacteria bacterium]